MYKFFVLKKLLAVLIASILMGNLVVLPTYAQEIVLPKPGMRVHLSPSLNPPMLKGVKVNPNDPFRFEFILDRGDSVETRHASSLQDESTRLIKYFLASLTIPEKDLWVNLSPYEKNRIVPDSFGLTEMGRDLLAQDYILKQVTASLIYPEDEVGKKFWRRVYEEASKKYGNTNIPVNTFNKVWIIPEKAVVYENAKAGTAYVVESKLKVMLEQDYLSLEKNTVGVGSPDPMRKGGVTPPVREANQIGSQIVREIVIPELTKEINEGANFAQLRQVYSSLILATWYKKKIKDSILSKVYADRNKIAGIQINDVRAPLAGDLDGMGAGVNPARTDVEQIYQQYLQAFKKGVYNYIKEEIDPASQERIPRKYFSGGVSCLTLDSAMTTVDHISGDLPDAAMKVDVRFDQAMGENSVDDEWQRFISENPRISAFAEKLVRSNLLDKETILASHQFNSLGCYFALDKIGKSKLLLADIEMILKKKPGIRRILQNTFIYFPEYFIKTLILSRDTEEIIDLIDETKGVVDIGRWSKEGQGNTIPEFLLKADRPSDINASVGTARFLDQVGLGRSKVYIEGSDRSVARRIGISEDRVLNFAAFQSSFAKGIHFFYWDRNFDFGSPTPGLWGLPMFPLKVDLPKDENVEAIRRVMGVSSTRKIILAASVSLEQTQAIFKKLSEIPFQERPLLVLAPRDPLSVSERRAMVGDSDFKIGIRSEQQQKASAQFNGIAVNQRSNQPQPMGQYDVVVVNTRGELAQLWPAVDLGIVPANRNAFEAVSQGVPVLSYFDNGDLTQEQITPDTSQREIFGVLNSANALTAVNDHNLRGVVTESFDHLDKLKERTALANRYLKEDVIPAAHFWMSIALLNKIKQGLPADKAMLVSPVIMEELTHFGFSFDDHGKVAWDPKKNESGWKPKTEWTPLEGETVLKSFETLPTVEVAGLVPFVKSRAQLYLSVAVINGQRQPIVVKQYRKADHTKDYYAMSFIPGIAKTSSNAVVAETKGFVTKDLITKRRAVTMNFMVHHQFYPPEEFIFTPDGNVIPIDAETVGWEDHREEFQEEPVRAELLSQLGGPEFYGLVKIKDSDAAMTVEEARQLIIPHLTKDEDIRRIRQAKDIPALLLELTQLRQLYAEDPLLLPILEQVYLLIMETNASAGLPALREEFFSIYNRALDRIVNGRAQDLKMISGIVKRKYSPVLLDKGHKDVKELIAPFARALVRQDKKKLVKLLSADGAIIEERVRILKAYFQDDYIDFYINQWVEPNMDRALVANPTGGIDLADVKLNSQGDGSGIQLHLDSAMLQQLQNAPGFIPVIMNIRPISDLRLFLGLNTKKELPAAV